MSKPVRIPAFCTQCRSRCGCVAVVADDRLLGVEPLEGHPSGAALCPKGRAAPELVHHPDRLLTPLRRTRPKTSRDPGWQPTSWDQALDAIAARMRAIAEAGGPEQVAFSVTTPSGSHISDSIAWIERLIRAFGSPNTVYGTELCNWHKDFASRLTYGYDIGTPDFAGAECIVLWGNNPAATWLARAVEVNRALARGARLVVVDPRPTALARRADVWLAVRPGTDQALALALAHLLISRGDFDRPFMSRWTSAPLLVREDTGRLLRESDLARGGSSSRLLASAAGGGPLLGCEASTGVIEAGAGEAELFAERTVATRDGPVRCRSAFALFAAAAAAWPPARAARVTGVPQQCLRRAAEALGRPARVAYYAWNGVGQSVNATQTDRALSLLYTLTGCYGGRGGNVPGAAAAFGDLSGDELLAPSQRAKALGIDERPLGPPRQGWITARDMYRAVLERRPYPVRMLMSFGTNLLTSQPDTALARAALEQLEFHAHADFFVNAAARYADILLPVATSWEREGLRTGFDVSLEGLRRVQLHPAVLPPRGESRADVDIVLGLARRLGLAHRFFDLDVDRGHDTVLARAGLSVAALRAAPAGVDVAGEVELDAHAARSVDGVERGFPTATRRIEIYSEALLEHGQSPLPALDEDSLPAAAAGFPLRLGSAKTVAFCHGQHRNVPSLRRLEPDPRLEMASADAAARGIASGDWVRIRSPRGEAVARARIVAKLPPGTVFARHGWWYPGPPGSPYDEAHPLAANINQLIASERADPVSGSLGLRAGACEVERLELPA